VICPVWIYEHLFPVFVISSVFGQRIHSFKHRSSSMLGASKQGRAGEIVVESKRCV
jgi:hypothetical protein